MPELPEIETIRRDLEKMIAGYEIVDFWTDTEKMVKPSVEAVREGVEGKIIEGVGRRGKMIIIKTRNSKLEIRNSKQAPNFKSQIPNNQASPDQETYLVFHLKLTGRLLVRRVGEKPDEYTRVVFKLRKSIDFEAKYNDTYRRSGKFNVSKHRTERTEGARINFKTVDKVSDERRLWDERRLREEKELELRFCDMRKFGWIRYAQIKKSKLKNQNDKSNIKNNVMEELFGNIGPEPLSEDFNLEYFQRILGNWGRPVKLLLMEQKKIAGVGNIYACEALWLAGVAPHHRARDLAREHPEKVEALYNSIKEVLREAIVLRGASGKDEAYRDAFGRTGHYQEHFKVYQREGLPCLNNCGKVIRRMTLGGRGTYFCPRCQK